MTGPWFGGGITTEDTDGRRDCEGCDGTSSDVEDSLRPNGEDAKAGDGGASEDEPALVNGGMTGEDVNSGDCGASDEDWPFGDGGAKEEDRSLGDRGADVVGDSASDEDRVLGQVGAVSVGGVCAAVCAADSAGEGGAGECDLCDGE